MARMQCAASLNKQGFLPDAKPHTRGPYQRHLELPNHRRKHIKYQERGSCNRQTTDASTLEAKPHGATAIAKPQTQLQSLLTFTDWLAPDTLRCIETLPCSAETTPASIDEGPIPQHASDALLEL